MSRIKLEEEVVNSYKNLKNLNEVRKKFKMAIKTIKNILLSHGVEVTLRKHPLDIEYFQNIDSPEKAYWLGFIAADGHICKSKHKLAFCVKDDDILFKFKSAINAGSPVRHRLVLDKRTNKVHEQYNLQIHSKKFCENIKSHGVTENKSNEFKFPNIKEDLYSHFIRGLYDGDGSICVKTSKIKKNKTCRINLISTYETVSFIKEYIEKKLNLTFQNIFSKHDQGIHYLMIQRNSIDFLNWIYKDSTTASRLDRKYKKYMEYKNSFEFKKMTTLKNEETGELFQVDNLSKFCQERGLNPNILRRNFKKNITCKSGKHANWVILN
jgi:hypothetical protein